MENIDKKILEIIMSVNNSAPVHLRSIDFRIMKFYPEVIKNRELQARIASLEKQNLLIWIVVNSSVQITKKGIDVLSASNHLDEKATPFVTDLLTSNGLPKKSGWSVFDGLDGQFDLNN